MQLNALNLSNNRGKESILELLNITFPLITLVTYVNKHYYTLLEVTNVTFMKDNLAPVKN